MMSLLTLALFAATQISVQQDAAQEDQQILSATWVSPDNPETEIMVFHSLDQLSPPKVSPLDKSLYAYSTSGQVSTGGTGDFTPRFRVFAQGRTETIDDLGQWTTRMLLRLWSYIHDRLLFDHSQMYRRLVDVYLSSSGIPGGETIRTVDEQERLAGRPAPPANVITLYQVDEYEVPFQLAREIAHEYGHAVISDFGPFQNAPESWANGDIGERLFLTWLYKDIKSGRLNEEDAVKTPVKTLEAYVETKVKPLAAKIALNGPTKSLAGDTGANGYEQLLALTCYAQTFLSPRILSHTLRYPVKNPGDYEKAILDVCAGRDSFVIEVPQEWRGKSFYIPAGSMEVTGANILERKGAWVKVKPSGSLIGVKKK